MHIVYYSENSIIFSIDWEASPKNKIDRQRNEFDDVITKSLVIDGHETESCII
jgi:hypothetical protein